MNITLSKHDRDVCQWILNRMIARDRNFLPTNVDQLLDEFIDVKILTPWRVEYRATKLSEAQALLDKSDTEKITETIAFLSSPTKKP